MLKSNRIKFYGETALSKNGAISTLNALQLTPASYISFLGIIPLLRPPLSSFVWKCFLARLYGSERARSLYGIAINPDRSLEIIRLCGLIPFPLVEIRDRRSFRRTGIYGSDRLYPLVENYSAYLRYKYRQKEKNGTFENDNLLKINTYKQHRIGFQQVL